MDPVTEHETATAVESHDAGPLSTIETTEIPAFLTGSEPASSNTEIEVLSPVSLVSDPQIPTESEPVSETTTAATDDGGSILSDELRVPLSDELAAVCTPTSEAAEPPPAPPPQPPAPAPAPPLATAGDHSGWSALFGESSAAADQEPATTDDSHSTMMVSDSQTSPTDASPPVSTTDTTITEKPIVSPTKPDDSVRISKSLFLLMLSYLIAVTLGFGYLLYQWKTLDFGLEALPDPVPLKNASRSTGFYLIPMDTELPNGHHLRIGDSRRFGNIQVTVLKVTRGPIRFVHFAEKNKKTRLPSAPVLKLWLKFENVSQDQQIAPLDDQLLFARSGKDRTNYRSNQFVCRLSEKSHRDGKRVIAYDHRIGSEWDLADLPLDKPLQPGESREYYVPTCENDLDQLTGDLVWRVHFRKGYSRSGKGVTTLFEVTFNSDDIRDDAA
jgi:hypothetical protein